MNIELEFPPDHQSLPHQASRSAYEPTVPQQVGQIELSLAAPRTILSQKFPVKIPRWGLALLILACTIMGCGYTVGTDFRQDIKTVAIPIFENETNRRGIEFQLTEAVQKEVTKRSQFRLAKGLEADTRLTGKIVGFRKDVLGETAQDDPRELQFSLMVRVRWEDLRTGTLLAEQELPLSPDAIPMSVQAEFAPELGQSLATAMDDALHSMARKIVNLMETPW